MGKRGPKPKDEKIDEVEEKEEKESDVREEKPDLGENFHEEEEVDESTLTEIQKLERKRNKLINEIKPKLLTKQRVKRGGSDVRRIHMHETTAYSKVFIEINQIGKKLGLPPIGLEHLRKE